MREHVFEVFFDGDCPLCRREISFLRRRDRNDAIRFTDIAARDFDARALGKTQQQLMAQIHGRLPDGHFVRGVEVFRQLYAAVGFGWVVRLTRLPGISWLLDRGYHWFAKRRLALTGRCDNDVCALPRTPPEQRRRRAA